MSPKTPKIRNINPKDLSPYEGNPRDNDDAVDRMVASITEYGFAVPVLIRDIELPDEETEDEIVMGLEVVDGHLRLKAAIKMGLAKVPTIDVSHLSEAQIKAFRIMVNQSVSWADWDEERLNAELQAIAQSDLIEEATLADVTGFDDHELDWLMKEATKDDATEGLEDGLGEQKGEDQQAAAAVSGADPDSASVKPHTTCPKCGHAWT